MRNSVIWFCLAFAAILCGCATGTEKPEPLRIEPRTVISVDCAGEGIADGVEARLTGYDYRLLAGGRYPEKKLWFSGDRIAFELSGLDVGKRYMLELETPDYETMDMPQTVVVDGTLVASGWKGERIGVSLSKECLDDSRARVTLISELQFSTLGQFRLIENPVRFPVEPIDMSRCEPFSEPSPAQLITDERVVGLVNVVVDAGASTGEFSRLWEGTMGIVPRMKGLNTQHARLWSMGLFGDTFTAEGVYSWEHLDNVVNHVVGLGAKPFITLSFVPKWLWREDASDDVIHSEGVPARRFGHTCPPRDLDKWKTLVRDIVAHLNVHRTIGAQYLEVWNEPTSRAFWNGTLAEYLELYEATAVAAKEADPSIKVGGPASAGLQPEWIRALIRHCSERNVPLDFVSWHCFSRDPARYGKQAAYVRELASEFGLRPELCITEWNYAWGMRELERLSAPFAASYALASLKAMEDAGVDLAIYFASADWSGLGTYSGLLLADMKTPKPVYNAFRMLSFLGTDRLKAASPARKSGLDVLAARNGDELGAIVWWWVQGTGREKADAAVNLRFTGLDGRAGYRWELYAIDDETSNFAADRGKQELTVVASGDVPSRSREFSIDITLPLYGVKMVRLIPV